MSGGASVNWSQWDRLPPGDALSQADPVIAHLIDEETQRQSDGLELIASECQQKGTINHTPVYPREVVKRALELGAASIILVHNHPT